MEPVEYEQENEEVLEHKEELHVFHDQEKLNSKYQVNPKEQEDFVSLEPKIEGNESE